MQQSTALAGQWIEPIWYSQVWEPEEAFDAFTFFKDLHKRERSMQEVARHVTMGRDQVLACFNTYHWRARAEAYDLFVLNGNKSLLHARKDDRYATHLHLVDLGLEVVKSELENLIEKQRSCNAGKKGITHLKPNEVRQLMHDCIKLERLVRGDVTERAEEEYDLSGFTTQELVDWRTLTTKARKTRDKNLERELDEFDS